MGFGDDVGQWPGTLYVGPVSKGRELKVDPQHRGQPLEILSRGETLIFGFKNNTLLCKDWAKQRGGGINSSQNS